MCKHVDDIHMHYMCETCVITCVLQVYYWCKNYLFNTPKTCGTFVIVGYECGGMGTYITK